jgi:hypothetical protein
MQRSFPGRWYGRNGRAQHPFRRSGRENSSDTAPRHRHLSCLSRALLGYTDPPPPDLHVNQPALDSRQPAGCHLLSSSQARSQLGNRKKSLSRLIQVLIRPSAIPASFRAPCFPPPQPPMQPHALPRATHPQVGLQPIPLGRLSAAVVSVSPLTLGLMMGRPAAKQHTLSPAPVPVCTNIACGPTQSSLQASSRVGRNGSERSEQMRDDVRQ